MKDLHGVGVSPGRAVGQVLRVAEAVAEPAVGEVLLEAQRVDAALQLRRAADHVAADLAARASRVLGAAHDVLAATAMLAADPAVLAAASRRVSDLGLPPDRAVWEAFSEAADQFRGLGGYLAERVPDLLDVRARVVAAVQGRPAPGVPHRSEPFVLVADDLAPADTATLDPAVCVAIVTEQGGPTSHTAILARELGIPAVVAARGALELGEGATVLVDGGAGRVEVDPSAKDIASTRWATTVRLTFSGEGRTRDGHRVQVLANVGDAAGAAAALEAGAEGVGLFRTEFCFLDRTEEPDIQEQVDAYRAVLAPFRGRKVVVRTLDAGADKPLPFVTSDGEVNPALGVRGFRTAARHLQVLEHQLTAIARAAALEDAEVWVMAPMVATVDEARDFVALATAAGLPMAGVMVETPSAALLADRVFLHARFASLGTNDLCQYTMAADRQLGELATLNDPWQPAVLELVRRVGHAGQAQDRPVGVCGEAASDPALAAVLVGLGVTSLSMSPRSIAPVAALVGRLSRAECHEVATLALGATSGSAGRKHVRDALAEHLGALGL